MFFDLEFRHTDRPQGNSLVHGLLQSHYKSCKRLFSGRSFNHIRSKECLESLEKNADLHAQIGAAIKMESNRKELFIQILMCVVLVTTIEAVPVTTTLTKEAKVSVET